MGTFCFKGDHDVANDQVEASRISRLPKTTRTTQSKPPEPGRLPKLLNGTMTSARARPERASEEWEVATALDEIIDRKVGASSSSGSLAAATPADYQRKRDELKRRERALGFEHKLASTASPKEDKANQILQDLKRDDDENVYAVAEDRKGWGGQRHPRFAGDHFLGNKALIDRSKVYGLAQRLPKGAHLHIHFNACLQPQVLLDIASGMEQMFITSDLPLLAAHDYHNYQRAKIQFSIMTHAASTGSLFQEDYRDRNGAMKFKDFIAEFERQYQPHHQAASQQKKGALEWLQDKLVFSEEEAHDMLQTASGAWQEFNTRTQMMKGLFNYETAYRIYTRKCLEDFVADNIQYAEVRPNFMDTNQVWKDDGTSKIDNAGIMEMIIEEYEKFQAREKDRGRRFGGMKIIYCCPRSWPNEKVAGGLRECLEFKQRWPQWIAGELANKKVKESWNGGALTCIGQVLTSWVKKAKANR